ncbi:MAG: ParB/RepB/Spo0J family partition protein [Clostridia bacterium]|nr:ParB/RepB/Spo0J family partition protein [Clostridia bacterium]
MALGKKGLGKGLDALLGDYSEPTASGLQELDIYLIDTNEDQPRKTFDKEKLEELAESLRLHGVVQPIVVRKIGERYSIIAGERRYRAARMAGLATVPVVIRDMDEMQAREVALIENIQRENLNPIEEAAAIKSLMDLHDLTQEEVSKRISKSRPAVSNSVRLLSLPEEVQDMVKEGKLQAGHARAILSIPDDLNRTIVARRIAESGASVREAEKLVKAELNPRMEPAVPKAEKRPADPDLRAAEDALRERLGTKVSIQGGMSKGKLVIEYYTKDQLSGLYDLLIGE